MHNYVAFLDTALDDIERHVAAHRPERGGALIGPVGLPVVTQFLFDPRAQTSGSTFTPSHELRDRVIALERADRALELKGILHSHPAGMNYPSSGDHVAYANHLRRTPWLGRYICPIVTHNTRRSGAHELDLPSGLLSVYVAEPRVSGEVERAPATVHILPVQRDTAALAQALGGTAGAAQVIEMDSLHHIVSSVSTDEAELMILLSAGYPTTAPTVILSPGEQTSGSTWTVDLSSGRARALPIAWNLETRDDARLLEAVLPFRLPQHPADERSSLDPTASPEGAPTPDVPAAQNSEEALNDQWSRLEGVVSPTVREACVVILGLGSGGSQTAEALVRSGVRRLRVLDPDEVSSANLSRSIYTRADVGTPKGEALRRHLQAIDPDVDVTFDARTVQELEPEDWKQVLDGAHLLVGATDDPGAQRLANRHSYLAGVPAVYAGLYAKGHGGEVVFTVPDITRCYRCATNVRHIGVRDASTLDYGTGRMHAEPALGADIQHVVSASLKLAIGLLELEDEDATNSSSRSLVLRALAAESNYLMMSMVPDYEFFAQVFAGVPSQLAYQSVWMQVQGDADCPVCGTSPVGLETDEAAAPDLMAIAARLGDAGPEEPFRLNSLGVEADLETVDGGSDADLESTASPEHDTDDGNTDAEAGSGVSR